MRKKITYIFCLLNTFCVSQNYFNNVYNADGDYRLSYDRGLVIKEYNNSYFILGSYDENKEYALGQIPYTGYATDTTRVLQLNVNDKGNIIYNNPIKVYTSCMAECDFLIVNQNGVTAAAAYFTSGSYCGSAPPSLPTPSGYPANQDALIMQTDFNGNVKWITTFGNTEKEGVWGLAESNNNGYLALCATTQSYSTYLIELNQQGDSLRRINLTINKPDYAPQYFGKTNTGYVAFYQVSSLAKTIAITMDMNGDTINSKIIPIYKPKWFKPTKDGGFIITQDWVSTQTRLFKLDKYLNLEWTNVYDINGNNFATETNDGNYIIGLKDFAKVDNKGNTIWNKRFFGPSNITPYYICHDGIQTSDAGFAFTGILGDDTFIIKTDCNGNIEWSTTSCILPTNENVIVLPNPFNEIITFQLPNINLDVDKIQIKITNILGQQLFDQEYSKQNIFTINTTQLSKGVYIYSIFVNNSFYKSDKIIKE